RTRDEFQEQLRRAGIEDQVTLFQGLKGPEINSVLNRSKVHVLLTKIEGGNVALMEAMAANVPSVVYKHIIGPRKGDFNAMTGVLADDDELPQALADTVDAHDRFRPREWFLQHTGFQIATQKLNEVLRENALARKEPWTRDIVPKFNRLGMQ